MVLRQGATRGGAPTLSRASIISAGIDLIEAQGVDRLSMRTLATAIGCGTMSLYSYVDGRDDLIDGIVEALVERSTLPRIASEDFESWQELVLKVQLAYRDLAFSYPRAFELLALAPYDVFPVAEHLERLVSALQRTGLSTSDAYEVLGALDAYSTGFLAVWSRTQRRDKEPDAAASQYLKSQRHPDAFERGLRVFIQGFERRLGER